MKTSPPQAGYASPTVVWDMPAEAAPRSGNYRVYVTGVKSAGKPLPYLTYTVKLFTAK